MKTLLVFLMTVLAPVHVTIASVTLPAGALLAAAEILAGAAGVWLVIHVIRRDGHRTRRHTWLAGGAW